MRTECDGCQTGVNSIALEHNRRNSVGQGRTKLPGRSVHIEKVREMGRR